MTALAAQLRDHGYALVHGYQQFEPYIEDAVYGWQQFLSLSERQRRRWRFDVGESLTPDDGYIRRTGGAHDRKHYFHYRPRLWNLLAEHGLRPTPWQHAWLTACDELYWACEDRLYSALRDLDEGLPGFGFERRAKLHGKHVLRLVWYELAHTQGGVIAQEHLDRSLLTIHVADSRPGLRLGEQRELIHPENGQICCFPGQKAAALTRGRISALPHCVTDEYPDDTGRWSIVFFGHDDTHVEEYQ